LSVAVKSPVPKLELLSIFALSDDNQMRGYVLRLYVGGNNQALTH